MAWISNILISLFVLGLAVYLQQTVHRIKAMKNQIGRLSLTFLKIEADIEATQQMLIVSAGNDEMTLNRLRKIHARKQLVFKDIVANGTGAAEIMRGLEEPDIDDDPNYWSQDRMKLFGFPIE